MQNLGSFLRFFENRAPCRQFGVPTTYTRVKDFGQHMDSIFRGGGDLYVGATYRRVYTVQMAMHNW